jgi:hypothetical protein
MYLQSETLIDLAIPIIYRDTFGSTVSFDDQNFLVVQNQITWGSHHPTYGMWKGYYRWWVCWTFQGTGYTLQTLAWGTGEGKPGRF